MTDTQTHSLSAWFWQREPMRRSREQLSTKSTQRLELEQQSMVLAEAGDRVLRPVSPLRSGSGEIAAAMLYKQSIALTLAALGSSIDRLAADDALRKHVSDALPDSISFELFCQLLRVSSEAQSDQADLSITSLQATALADVAHALLELARAPELGLQRIQNRRDCCRDRAFPLVIEGSLDGEKWRELGRQTKPFSQWTLELQPTEVRYVRAKALKRTVLHLEGFEVR